MLKSKSKKKSSRLHLRADSLSPRDRVLEAAIDLFATRGFDAVTVRDITSRAGTNLAAINYYFDSKDNLIRTVFKHAAQPMNNMRLQELAAYEASRMGQPLEVEPILRSLVDPMIRCLLSRSVLANLAHIYAYCVMWPPSSLTVTFDQGSNDDILMRYIDALSRALPHWPRADIGWIFYFATGALFTSARDIKKNFHFRRLFHNEVDTSNPDVLVERLMMFLLSVFRDQDRLHIKACPTPRKRKLHSLTLPNRPESHERLR